jgi:histone deacetylase complex regulatory component SIN3
MKRKLAKSDDSIIPAEAREQKTKGKKGKKQNKKRTNDTFKLSKELTPREKFFWSKTDMNIQERLKACSGRDEMCYSVLNDDWASHPTWASEDSGFVAHRKNVFEEGLHRIEEERHDYDFNIEANQKVIQLLEPIGQQILTMTPAELATFRMPANLGGSSPSIHKRILKKIYGPERGAEVAADLFKDPIAVLPTILARLKQKDEEWRFTQVSNLHGKFHTLSLTGI